MEIICPSLIQSTITATRDFTPFLFKALLMQIACFGIYYYRWVGSIYALILFKFVEVRKKGKLLPYKFIGDAAHPMQP
jgi:hypothetical protein